MFFDDNQHSHEDALRFYAQVTLAEEKRDAMTKEAADMSVQLIWRKHLLLHQKTSDWRKYGPMFRKRHRQFPFPIPLEESFQYLDRGLF